MDRFRLDVANLLSQAGCDVFGEADLREAARECRDEIYLDELEHAGDVDSPFFDFLVVPAKDSKDIAVFTFFEESFSIYVFDCEPDYADSAVQWICHGGNRASQALSRVCVRQGCA